MILQRPVRAVVFDMDGLLFDTEKLHARAALAAAKEVGCELTMDVFRRLLGTTEARRILQAHYGDSYPFDELRVAWGRQFKVLAETELELKPGALNLLDLLDELGLPRAIATSSSHKAVQHHLAAHDLAQRFHVIVAAGDYSASKPAPDPFLRAAERLAVAPGDCLVLEDSHNGIRSASAAGMMAVMVPDLIEPTAEIERLCRIVPSLHDVRELILSSRRGSEAASS
ncbi:MAG: HAD family phosphatase [Proteobacteria bacterium]|nr:HAD family phosphatase [Pseudomonadota bacterium]